MLLPSLSSAYVQNPLLTGSPTSSRINRSKSNDRNNTHPKHSVDLFQPNAPHRYKHHPDAPHVESQLEQLTLLAMPCSYWSEQPPGISKTVSLNSVWNRYPFSRLLHFLIAMAGAYATPNTQVSWSCFFDILTFSTAGQLFPFLNSSTPIPFEHK